jgi:hypothetical protein
LLVFEEYSICEYIGASAFSGIGRGITTLQSVVVPVNAAIAANAFAHCVNIEIVFYCGNSTQFSQLSIGQGNTTLNNIKYMGEDWDYIDGVPVLN